MWTVKWNRPTWVYCTQFMKCSSKCELVPIMLTFGSEINWSGIPKFWGFTSTILGLLQSLCVEDLLYWIYQSTKLLFWDIPTFQDLGQMFALVECHEPDEISKV